MSSERDQSLPYYRRHMTPRDVAEYMRTTGSDIGREYKTHGDVWDADDATLKTGLLHLILDELQRLNCSSDELLRRHALWLKHFRQDLACLIAKYDKERYRLVRMFKTDKLGPDMKNEFTLLNASQIFRSENRREYREWLTDLESKYERLRSVKRPEDIKNLRGVGKKKAAQLIAARLEK